MSDGAPHPVTFRRWDGMVELPVDRAIADTRNRVYPLRGLDPTTPATNPLAGPRAPG
jgi:hypothetical protein